MLPAWNEQIPGARYVELPGDDHHWWAGDVESILDEVEEFLTGARRGADLDRVLATILVTDIVGSTEQAVALGDQRWGELFVE
jgi:class 3 adenylate cyclase